MKKIIKYESCDGEIFDTEEECWEHENEYYPNFSGFTCLDEDMNLLMLDPENGHDLEWMYLESVYIVIHDIEEATPGLNRIFSCGPLTLEECGMTHEGYFMWDRDVETWNDIDAKILEYRMLKREVFDKLNEFGRL